jgi:diketogulonate reductase-like aldo/keto reductase
MYKTLTQTITLESGYDMPVFGLGIWEMRGPVCERAVTEAIDIGYRAIDTAELYENETQIGDTIQGFPRKDLFLTSKVSKDHLAPVNVMAACQDSLSRLQIDYLDLYLVHWPNDEVPLEETLLAMNELIQMGWVRSIGVSNFNKVHLGEAIVQSPKPICVNQIEYHPYTHRERLPAFCADCRVAITAYSPLARGHILNDPVLTEVGRPYGKTAEQVSLKWLLQQGHLVIPKASCREHLLANAAMDDWELTPQDMARIASIGVEKRLVDTVYT